MECITKKETKKKNNQKCLSDLELIHSSSVVVPFEMVLFLFFSIIMFVCLFVLSFNNLLGLPHYPLPIAGADPRDQPSHELRPGALGPGPVPWPCGEVLVQSLSALAVSLVVSFSG